jgi:hypothetical protein
MSVEDVLSKGGLINGFSKAPSFKYTVPKKLAAQTGVTEIGIGMLTAEDDAMAAQRGKGNGLKVAYELAKQSLRWYVKNGSRINVSTADHTIDEFWNNPDHAKLRTLVTSAYNDVNQPEADETESFLGSAVAVAD